MFLKYSIDRNYFHYWKKTSNLSSSTSSSYYIYHIIKTAILGFHSYIRFYTYSSLKKKQLLSADAFPKDLSNWQNRFFDDGMKIEAQFYPGTRNFIASYKLYFNLNNFCLSQFIVKQPYNFFLKMFDDESSGASNEGRINKSDIIYIEISPSYLSSIDSYFLSKFLISHSAIITPIKPFFPKLSFSTQLNHLKFAKNGELLATLSDFEIYTNNVYYHITKNYTLVKISMGPEFRYNN